MTKNYAPNIGELCHPDARRDAIHFAVAPVTAARPLSRGQHVGLLPGRLATDAEGVPLVGIVDPMLPEGFIVAAGQTFWLLLYPNTVHNLRHIWEHPAFLPQVPHKEAPKSA